MAMAAWTVLGVAAVPALAVGGCMETDDPAAAVAGTTAAAAGAAAAGACSTGLPMQ